MIEDPPEGLSPDSKAVYVATLEDQRREVLTRMKKRRRAQEEAKEEEEE